MNTHLWFTPSDVDHNTDKNSKIYPIHGFRPWHVSQAMYVFRHSVYPKLRIPAKMNPMSFFIVGNQALCCILHNGLDSKMFITTCVKLWSALHHHRCRLADFVTPWIQTQRCITCSIFRLWDIAHSKGADFRCIQHLRNRTMNCFLHYGFRI
jgi:hypothetical protein